MIYDQLPLVSLECLKGPFMTTTKSAIVLTQTCFSQNRERGHGSIFLSSGPV